MANMGYCRFQNTKSDLDDCIDVMENDEIESDEEWNAMQNMVRMCERFIELSEQTTRMVDDDDDDH